MKTEKSCHCQGCQKIMLASLKYKKINDIEPANFTTCQNASWLVLNLLNLLESDTCQNLLIYVRNGWQVTQPISYFDIYTQNLATRG
ncbi:MAG: hypothetical protein ABIJ59_19550 [Pseudomonadota bacterium]